MTATSMPLSTTPSGGVRRFAALVRAETRILLRNKTAMFGAMTMPPVMAFAFAGISKDANLGGLLVTMLLGMGLLFVVYYTLVTSLVAHREQLVLKRLRTGEATTGEILLAPAVPLWGLLVMETLMALILAVTALDLHVAQPLALIPAIVLGASAWTGLAIWSATFTRTVESAQLTTMPALLVTLLFSGFSIPLDILPETAERLAHWLPLTPVVDLTRLAFTGVNTAGTVVTGTDVVLAAASMSLVLLAWTALSLWEGVNRFRWEPRS